MRDTLLFFRNTPGLFSASPSDCSTQQGIDLIRFESLNSLDAATCTRVLNKNYHVLISMAPLSNEVKSISSCLPYHIGPPISEVNSVWFKLWLYHLIGDGPSSILYTMGSRIKKIPKVFWGAEKLLMTTWNHDSTAVNCHSMLSSVNEALLHSPVLLQEYTYCTQEPELVHVPFPFDDESEPPLENAGVKLYNAKNMYLHPSICKLRKLFDLQHSFGYVTMLKRESLESYSGDNYSPSSEWTFFNLCFGIPLFSKSINRVICERISKFKIFETENLQKNISFTRQMSLKLLDFIMKFEDIYVDKAIVNSSKRSLFQLGHDSLDNTLVKALYANPTAELGISAVQSTSCVIPSITSSRESLSMEPKSTSTDEAETEEERSPKKSSKQSISACVILHSTLSKFIAHPSVDIIFYSGILNTYSEYDFDFQDCGRVNMRQAPYGNPYYNDAGYFFR